MIPRDATKAKKQDFARWIGTSLSSHCTAARAWETLQTNVTVCTFLNFPTSHSEPAGGGAAAAGGRPLMLGEMGDLVEFSCRWSRRYAGAGATAKKKGKRDCHHDILLWHDFHL